MRNILLIFIALAALAGCTGGDLKPEHRNTLPITDGLGRSVSLAPVPSRIISMAPNLTEMVYALGAGSRLVGVTAWCNYPPEARTKPVVGDAVSANLEMIVSLEPDLVLMVGTAQTPLLPKLEGLNIPVLVFNPSSPEDIGRTIGTLGHALGRRAGADTLLEQMARQIEDLRSRVSVIPWESRPRVFAEISSNPLMTAGRNSFVGRMITLAGGRNIMGDLDADYAVVNPELVVQRRPDMILVLHPQADQRQVSSRIGWKSIPAVANGRIYDDLDMDVVLRAGPRYISGLKELHRRMYAP